MAQSSEMLSLTGYAMSFNSSSHTTDDAYTVHTLYTWRGVAATRCVESTKLLYGGPG